MAWIKIPAEHHPLFRAELPRDGRISVIQMFGGLAALCNGNIFGGLFARSIIVRLSPADHVEAMSLDGAGLFDPMGNGRTMGSTVLMPEELMEDPVEIRRWLDRAFKHVLTLPPKEKKKPAAKAAKAAAKPAKPTARAAKPAAKAAKPAAKLAKPTAKATKLVAKTVKPAAKSAKPTAKATKLAAKAAKPTAKRAPAKAR